MELLGLRYMDRILDKMNPAEVAQGVKGLLR